MNPPTAEYVWIDIACIDQNPNSLDTALEIGRQAKIFAGALRSYVWLSRTHYDTLTRTLTNGRDEEDFSRQADNNLRDRVLDLDDIPGVEFIQYLASDPWFTSLWTLQEAFLCPEAMIMTKDARESLRMWNDHPSEARLNVQQIVMLFQFTFTSTVTETRGDHTEAPNWTQSSRERIKQTIEETGLLHLTSKCPTSLLAMAQYRQTSPDNQTDRIYGIMQCFDLRVGKSRPGASPDLALTLDQLEDELGAALMKKNPVMSQLHVYETTPPLGKGWRLTKESMPAPWFGTMYMELGLGKLDQNIGYELVFHSQMSTVEMDTTTWGLFEGPTIPLSRLRGIWENEDHWRLGLEVDVDCPEPMRIDPNTDYNNSSVPRQYKGVDRILKQHPESLVLLLGENKPTSSSSLYKHQAFALIIAPHEIDGHPQRLVWRRQAICAWTVLHAQLTAGMGSTDPNRDQDRIWEHLEGILG